MSTYLISSTSDIYEHKEEHPEFVGTYHSPYARAILALTASFRRKPNPRIDGSERFRGEAGVVSKEAMAELVKYLPSLPESYPELSAKSLTELSALIKKMAASEEDFVVR